MGLFKRLVENLFKTHFEQDKIPDPEKNAKPLVDVALSVILAACETNDPVLVDNAIKSIRRSLFRLDLEINLFIFEAIVSTLVSPENKSDKTVVASVLSIEAVHDYQRKLFEEREGY